MQGRILLPGEVGAQLEPSLTFEGLRSMVRDMRESGQRIPEMILVSEYERRDLNQEILGASVDVVAKEDERPEHDGAAIGFVEGVMIRAHPDVPRGKARFVYPAVIEGAKPLPSGKLISMGSIGQKPKALIVGSG